jgi:UDP-galactopyranose mutase
LLAAAAAARPDWQWIMLGPVVKVDPATLPRAPNLHYLGGKRYDELPTYLGHWDAAMMPFALNEATRFISPTKTPEYVAAGLAVVSTPVADVVRGWGDSGVVHIAGGTAAFIRAAEAALAHGARSPELLSRAEKLLRGRSWDRTVADMNALIDRHLDVPRSAVLGTATTTATPEVPA